MAYSELIKDINRIRPYIRDFYVFGLYTRTEYATRYGISPRSYDNECRRVESWLQGYLDFYQNSSGNLQTIASSIMDLEWYVNSGRISPPVFTALFISWEVGLRT